VRRSRTTPKKQPAASGSSNAEGKLPAAVGVAVGVAVEQGVSVENVLAPSGPLPRFAAALPVDAGAAAAKEWQDDEEARRKWAEEDDAAQQEYDEQWLTERRPTLEYISKGEQYVADKTVPIFRLQGEVSACQAMTSRLGAPTGADLRTDAAWRWLNENEWMDALIDEAVDAAPEERKVGVGEELQEMRRDLGWRDVPLLRKFAQEMYPHRDDLHACHGWDAHLRSGGLYSKVHVTGRLLARAVAVVIQQGLVDGYREDECPVSSHNFVTAAGSVTWRSLHPCMHWMCESCKKKWIDELLNGWCPVCKQPIKFTRTLVRPE